MLNIIYIELLTLNPLSLCLRNILKILILKRIPKNSIYSPHIAAQEKNNIKFLAFDDDDDNDGNIKQKIQE
jgi:hypothetical protein